MSSFNHTQQSSCNGVNEMIVYRKNNFVIDKCKINQCHNTSINEFFVDDLHGKNHRVFKNIDAAKKWIRNKI